MVIKTSTTRSLTLFSSLLVVLLLSACGSDTSKATLTVEHASRGAFSAALSADGRYSLVSSIEHGAMLWDNQEHGLKYQWRHSSEPDELIHSLAIANDNSTAVTAADTTFAIWSIDSGENLGYYEIETATIRDVAISNRGQFLLIARSDNVVVHLDLESGRRIEFLGHQENINSIAMSPNGRFALTGGNDYSAYFWDTRTGQVIHRFNHPSRVTKVALDNQGRYAFTADSMKKASIWQLTTGELKTQLQYIARQKIFSAVRFNDSATLLATGSPNRELILWRIEDGKRLQTWRVQPREGSRPKSAVVFDVAFQQQGKALLTESSSGLLEKFEQVKHHE
ncbi:MULTISPECIES: WD40 repeat domain-containing protein [unclassified Pseudoalteromonas]|uniref:WD40 repeat domain-containing protein n=1 Tax=unclassified Pseudoalteromonas TaxID=194690 RepID=UPI0030148B00